MLLPKPKWRDIEGYEGLYQVSNIGNVRSLNYGGVKGKVKRLKPDISKHGYKIVVLCKDSKTKRYSVHRLVAEAFIPNPNDLPCVNHKDENKTNNCTWNLEWCTYQYNSNYGTIKERISKANKESCKGRTAWNKGIPQTEEQKKKNREAHKGKTLSDEHKRKIGEAHKGEKHHSAKKVKCIETGVIYPTIADANEALGKPRRRDAIGRCVRGETKTAYKLHWEYVEE